MLRFSRAGARSPSRFKAGAAVALVAVLLAACGGGGTDTPATTPVVKPSPEPSSSVPSPGPSASTGSGAGTGTGTGTGAGTSSSSGQIYVVGSHAALPQGATRVQQLTDVPWATLKPGSTVIVSIGNFNGPVTIAAQGSSTAPIKVQAEDPAQPPVVNNSFDFQNAAWVQVSHVSVQSPAFAGFVIRRGSHHITVADSLVSNAPMGVNITDGAGTGHAILRNTIQNSTTHGIGVDGVNAAASDRTLIKSNVVTASGVHGIEVRGSNYQIESNVVSHSGRLSGGTSGIHIFSASQGDGTGAGNVVRYNFSYSNADTTLYDGNGIEVDQWCDGNTVAFNVVWGNDGSGIMVYNGNNNLVYGNTAHGNGLDPGGTHTAAQGELILNGNGAAGRPANNQVFNNVLVSARSAVPAMYVDTRAVAQGSNSVGPNLMFNEAGGSVLRWTDSQLWRTAAQINAATGSTGNLVANPAFVNAAQPLTGGLALSVFPGGVGRSLAGQSDITGQMAQVGWALFGAYFKAP